MNCLASSNISLTLGSVTKDVSPSAMINSGATEYDRSCEALNWHYEGTFDLICDDGALTGDISACAAKSCGTGLSVEVTTANATALVSPPMTMASSTDLPTLCEDIDHLLTGIITLSCFGGVLSATEACTVKPCETWDFVIGTVHGVSGLVYPSAQILSGASGYG